MDGKLRMGVLALAVALGACAAPAASDGEGAVAGDADDLTSLTARQRKLTFEGVVYVGENASDEEILAAAHAQTQTAFGALLHAEVSVRTRELQNLTTKSLVKRPVTVIDPSRPGDPGYPGLEVKYVYEDDAVVPVAMARRTTLPLAVLAKGSQGKHVPGVVSACTTNDAEARDDADMGLLWYDFDPGTAACKRAIEAEQKIIDADTKKLVDPKHQVARSRIERTYLPTTMALARAATATTATYPEYDRLFEKDALTIAIVNGRLAHERVEAVKDDGYYEWMDALDVLLEAHPDLAMTSVSPTVDVTRADVGGKTYADLRFQDFVRWTVYGDGWPKGLPAADRNALAKQIADKLDGKWVTFEKTVKLQKNDEAPRDFTIRITTLFGADEDPEPHRQAVKRGDVVLYNGHSYIGYGPLDPSNFERSSFTSGYQILFFDSCVSYNYYEKDFFSLKEGGSKNLEIITNGIEAPESLSGASQGAFVSKLIDGSMPSYQTLLKQAAPTDSLRVVDGEIDNTYRPSKTRLRFSR